MPALKSAKSTTWFVRIDGEEDVLRPKVIQFAESIDLISMLATAHKGKTGENPHCHAVIEMRTEVQKQSFALRIKRHFQVVDRGYALDTWDNRRTEYGAVSYLFHEEAASILVSKGWTSDEIQTVQRIACDANKVIAKAKDKASVKIVDRAIAHFEQWQDEPTNFQIFTFLVQEVSEGRTYWPGTFKAKQLVEEIQIKLSKNLAELTSSLFNSTFRV